MNSDPDKEIFEAPISLDSELYLIEEQTNQQKNSEGNCIEEQTNNKRM